MVTDTAELGLPGLEQLGKEVAIGDIDRELHAFFSSDQGIARASLMNLAVYSEDPESLEKNTLVIRALTGETACRAILILSVPDGRRTVRAWIEAHCHLTDAGEKAVCSEQVSFVLGGSSANLVRNIVFAHLDADLPVVVWWQDELSDIFEERLYSRIDRLIVDSRAWRDPASQLLRITVARGGVESPAGASFIPHDLSYTRTNPIRAAIAGCFDDPRAQGQVGHLSEAEIVHAPGHRISGLWLTAWLADRLGCRLDEAGSRANRYVFRKTGNGFGPFAVTLLEEASGDPDGRQAICRVRLGSAEGRVAIWRSDDRKFWKIVSEIPEMPVFEELIPARDRDEAGLVGEVLTRAGQNRVMGQAMGTLRELLTV